MMLRHMSPTLVKLAWRIDILFVVLRSFYRVGLFCSLIMGLGKMSIITLSAIKVQLMCHYRHHAHVDPFYLPGLQDITCHVNFSAISDEANKSNLELFGYVTQANFLLNCGITDILSGNPN